MFVSDETNAGIGRRKNTIGCAHPNKFSVVQLHGKQTDRTRILGLQLIESSYTAMNGACVSSRLESQRDQGSKQSRSQQQQNTRAYQVAP
ncbi:MAG: hypothetical protein FD124_3240 [Alphaproteobacteria bacterium]|nr:MAG: hypothetical protein FD124_3240 [Alphaproteobacteria bacterium]